MKTTDTIKASITDEEWFDFYFALIEHRQNLEFYYKAIRDPSILNEIEGGPRIFL